MPAEDFCLGDRIVTKRRLGILEQGSTGVVLDIDSHGNITIKMTCLSGVSEYVIVVNDIDVLEKE